MTDRDPIARQMSEIAVSIAAHCALALSKAGLLTDGQSKDIERQLTLLSDLARQTGAQLWETEADHAAEALRQRRQGLEPSR